MVCVLEYDDTYHGGEMVGVGSTSQVVKLSSPSLGIVIKLPFHALAPDLIKFEHEAQVLRRLDRHPGIVKYLGVANESPMDGLVFEEALGGNLQKYILAHHGNILPIQRHRWCAQAAQTLAYCHKRGVLHCDLRPENFLLDEHLDLLMCDFGGSSLEGHFEGLGLPDYGFFDPTCGDPFTVTAGTEIFGLGSVMFFIMAGALPYESQFAQKANDVQDYAIAFAQKLRQHKWAEVEGPMASIIQGCWTREFASVEEVVLAMARRRLVLHESYHCLDSVPT